MTLRLGVSLKAAAEGRTFTVEVSAVDDSSRISAFAASGLLVVLSNAVSDVLDAEPAVKSDVDDSDKPRKETEEERQQRQHTNRSGKSDVHTEGNVVSRGAAADGRSLLATIGLTRGETLVVQVPCSGDGSNVTCPDIQAGDYLEADGYQNGVGDPNDYFVASDSYEVLRNGKKVK